MRVSPRHAQPWEQHGPPFARHLTPGLLWRGCLCWGDHITWEKMCGQHIPPALPVLQASPMSHTFTTHPCEHFTWNPAKPTEPQLPSRAERVLKCSGSSHLNHKPIQQFLFKGCCLCPCGKCIYCFGFLLLCAKVQVVLCLLLRVMVCPQHTSPARADARLQQCWDSRAGALCGAQHSCGWHCGAALGTPSASDKMGNSGTTKLGWI